MILDPFTDYINLKTEIQLKFLFLANSETLITRRDRYGPSRRWLHDFVTHRYFELIIASIIGLNILAMSLEHYSQVSQA